MKYFATLLIPILILCAAQADALLQPFTVDELSKLSRFIIIGTVMDVKPTISDEKAALSDDLDALLYDVTMSVEKDLTNQYKNDTIKFRIMGNRDLGSYSKAVEDSQEFTAGERVLVFLADKEPKSIWGDNYYVTGITIGKYTLDEGRAYGVHYDGILEDELISKIHESRFQYPIPDPIYFSDPDYSIYSIKHKQYKYFIPYKISGATIQEMKLDCNSANLLVYLQEAKEGDLIINIPRKMFDVKLGPDGKSGEDDDFIVLTDGKEPAHEEMGSDMESRTLQIPFAENTKLVEIIGPNLLVLPYMPICGLADLEESSYHRLLAPLQQLRSGISTDEIKCKKGLYLTFKSSNGSPTCVKESTLERLVQRGWAEPPGNIIFEKPIQSVQDLTEKSDRIITGIVTDKEKVGNHTEVWIGVYEWIKRPPYDAGSIILDLDDTKPFESKANFNKNEEVLLFLKDIDPNNGRFGLEYLQNNTTFKYSISMKGDVLLFVKPEQRVREYSTDENCKNLTWNDDSFLYCMYPDKESRFYVPIQITLDHVKEKFLQHVSEQYLKDHFDLKRAYDEAVVNGHITPVGQSMEFDYHIGNMTFNYMVRTYLDNSEVYLYYVPPREIKSIPFESKVDVLIYSCLEPGTYKVFWGSGIGKHVTNGFSPFSEGYGPPEIRNRYGDLVRDGDEHFRIWHETGDVECAPMRKDYSNNKFAIPGQDKILLIDSTEFLKIKNRK